MAEITFKLLRGREFYHPAEAEKFVNGGGQGAQPIPQKPATPLEIAIKDKDEADEELQVWMDSTEAPSTTRWHFTYDSTTPESVTVTIGPD